MRGIGLKQGVTVGRGFGGQCGTDHRAGTGAVVDHHLLSPQLAQLVRECAPQQITRTARTGADNQAHRFVRVI